jgi:hypothetical protein
MSYKFANRAFRNYMFSKLEYTFSGVGRAVLREGR